jgi:BTB/POZ domain
LGQSKHASPRPTNLLNSHLQSKVVAVEVNNDEGSKSVYYVHSSLICAWAEKFKNAFSGRFKEASTLKISLEESADDFEWFLEYLYSERWEFGCTSPDGLVIMASLYAMGERFAAYHFQGWLLDEFCKKAPAMLVKAPATVFCQLLKVAATQIIPRKNPDDPMRELIYSLAAENMARFNSTREFTHQLGLEAPEAGIELCARVGKPKVNPLEYVGWYDQGSRK